MARRYSTRGIRKARVYTIKQAARIVGVSEVTFRKWPKQGLKIISDKRPYLVRGEELIDFLRKRQSSNRMHMRRDQFRCLSCDGPCDAANQRAEFRPLTELTGRLSANCKDCGNKVGRFCSIAQLHALGETLTIVFKAKTQA